LTGGPPDGAGAAGDDARHGRQLFDGGGDLGDGRGLLVGGSDRVALTGPGLVGQAAQASRSRADLAEELPQPGERGAQVVGLAVGPAEQAEGVPAENRPRPDREHRDGDPYRQRLRLRGVGSRDGVLGPPGLGQVQPFQRREHGGLDVGKPGRGGSLAGRSRAGSSSHLREQPDHAAVARGGRGP
jgi:hypothetical protein